MEDQMNASVVRERGLAWLATAFAVLAAMLSLVGLYGVMSYRVARRTREFGIRLAIGARPGAVLRGVLGESLWLAAAGIGVGLIGTWFATDLVSTFLYGLSPRDPLTLVSVSVGLVLTAVAATYLPARRAARIDPLRALRVD
jgi:ABC-type antimicrobial peptide transport system permease subunit